MSISLLFRVVAYQSHLSHAPYCQSANGAWVAPVQPHAVALCTVSGQALKRFYRNYSMIFRRCKGLIGGTGESGVNPEFDTAVCSSYDRREPKTKSESGVGLDSLPFEEMYTRVYEIVALIPLGQVATYGQIARIVGPPCSARMAGWALRATPAGLEIPWQRVINARGEISTQFREAEALLQRQLLEAEGIEFDERGRTDLNRFGWEGPDSAWLGEHGYPQPSDESDEESGPRQLGLF
jgi:methylated-DNA-protein-cysteine methyltransferase-like protein